MKRFGAALLVIAMAAALAWAAGKVTVIHKKTSLRADKQFFAPALAEIPYKESLEALETQNGWIKVTYAGKTGWIHSSAVSGAVPAAEKKGGALSLFGGDDDKKNVAQEDVALAGKGFNEQVEKQYKQKNPNMNFAAVDEMEKITIPGDKLAAFVQQGGLEARSYEN
ncbi:MAG: SH3 domain-containing protein [Nitrospinae bacterium]|nr:SH3 domain-containing protein [Nitrospinota bacterium]